MFYSSIFGDFSSFVSFRVTKWCWDVFCFVFSVKKKGQGKWLHHVAKQHNKTYSSVAVDETKTRATCTVKCPYKRVLLYHLARLCLICNTQEWRGFRINLNKPASIPSRWTPMLPGHTIEGFCILLHFPLFPKRRNRRVGKGRKMMAVVLVVVVVECVVCCFPGEGGMEWGQSIAHAFWEEGERVVCFLLWRIGSGHRFFVHD